MYILINTDDYLYFPTGLNINPFCIEFLNQVDKYMFEIFDVKMGTFYKTNDLSHNILQNRYIMPVIIPNEIIKDLHTPPFRDFLILIGMGLQINIGSNKFILGDKYNIYDIKTLIKFNLNVDDIYVNDVCSIGKVDILDWLKNKKYPIKCNKKFLENASKNGHVNVLEWCKSSGYSIKCHKNVLAVASKYGHVNVLEWWFNSNIPLKYDNSCLNEASVYGHIDVLNCWKNSGLLLKYDPHVLYWLNDYTNEGILTINKNIDVIKWWKNSGLFILYPPYYSNEIS